MARLRRWIWRAVIAFVTVIVLVVGALLLVLANLDAGPVKRFAQSQARAQGLAIDYDDGSVTLGALRFRNLRLLSPPADAALAPALVKIGAIDGRWSPLSRRIDDLVVRDVELTVVIDEDGKTSLDRLLAGMPPSPEKPAEPLSRLASALVPEGLAARARIENLVVTVIPRTPRAGERMQLVGLSAAAELGGGRLRASIGPGELRLAVGEKAAVAKLAAAVDVARAGQLQAKLDVELVKQDLAAGLPPVKRVIALAASAEFLPAEHRTRARVESLTLLDGAASFVVDADLRDGEAGAVVPLVRAASCRVDLQAVARALPKELGPIAIDGEPLTCQARDFELLPAPRGDLTLSGKIARLLYRDLEVKDVTVAASAHPDGGAFQATVKLALGSARMPDLSATGVTVDAGAGRAASARQGWPMQVTAKLAAATVATASERVAGARVRFEGTLDGPTAVTGKANVDVDKVVAADAALDAVHLDVDLDKLVLADLPVLSTGKLELAGKIDRVAQPKGAQAAGVAVALVARLAGAAPSSASLKLGADRLAVPGLGRDFPPGKAELTVDAPRIQLDADPKKTHGEARLSAAWGGASIGGSVAGSLQALTWDLTARAERLGPARALALASKGSYAKQIAQETTVDVGRVATADATLRGAHLRLTSAGTLRRQDATLSAALDGVSVGGKSIGSPRIDLTAAADLDRSRVDLELKGQSPDAALKLLAQIDRARTLHWELSGRVAKLAPLAPLLPAGPDWSLIVVDVKGRGALSGVVQSVDGGVPALVAKPAAAARGKQSLELALRELHYKGAAETSADAGSVGVRAAAELGATHHATVDVDVPDLAAVASGVHLAVSGLRAHLDASASPRGVGKADLTVRAGEIKQSAFAYYPVRDLELSAGVSGDPASAISVRAALANPGAGTRFELAGEIDQRAAPGKDAVSGRHSLALDGKLEQALDKLDAATDRLRARGRLSVPFRVESGDLDLFHVSALLALEGVRVELPADKIVVSGVDGQLPVVEELVMGPEGAEMVGSGEHGLYPQLRWSDQQPFLGGDDFLSIAELRIGDRAIGPLAGNARVDHDVLALDQLEMSALGGKISGQTMVEVRGKDTRVTFRGKVTGIKPSSGSGDRLDANAAITMMPYRMGMEGRVEIVRIGRDHLLDLLDVMDPYRADVAMNRVRLGLKLGYPKQVRLHFQHGFASLAIELGGLAAAVRIDDITGIPIGPAMARFLGPLLEAKK